MSGAGLFSAWGNPPILLYHGTTADSARSIRERIDLRRCRRNTDFGRGFYTTTSKSQAWEFAQRFIALGRYGPGESPAIVWFAVDREALGNLASMAFVRYGKDADDYWSLVQHCRGGCDHRRPGAPWYDWVCGPVAKMPTSNREAWAGFDQFSFHTEPAAAMLDDCEKGISHAE